MESEPLSAVKSFPSPQFPFTPNGLEAGCCLRSLISNCGLGRCRLADAHAVSLVHEHHAEPSLCQHPWETALTRPERQLLCCIVPMHRDGRMDTFFVAVTVVLILI